MEILPSQVDVEEEVVEEVEVVDGEVRDENGNDRI